MDNILDKISLRLGQTLTDEQTAFIEDFDHNIISNSNPGSGKTTAAIDKLLLGELNGKYKPCEMTAISYTKIAKDELNNRYDECHKKLGMLPRGKSGVQFKTLHALCLKILSEHYKKIGIKRFGGASSMTYSESCDIILDTSNELGLNVTKKKVRAVKRAIDVMNSSLIFDPNHIQTKQAFIDCKISIEDFTEIRKQTYELNRLIGSIQLKDILLYTLELLMKYPEISEEQKRIRKFTICDEFQDMSMLQLKVLSLITDKLVVIGDINQQIYAFNGACSRIVPEFKRLYPDFKEYNLTKSFRCGHQIAEFATRVVKPNGYLDDSFTGREDMESQVTCSNKLDYESICKKIGKEYRENDRMFKEEIMFLYRNNFSCIPLFEELYQEEIPFRTDKFVKAYDVDIISDLVALVRIAKSPKDPSKLWILKKILPEFNNYKDVKDIPLVKIMKETGSSVFEINYTFKDQCAGDNLFDALISVQEMLSKGKTVSDLFNRLWPIYNAVYLESNFFRYGQDADFYIKLVSPITQVKTFDQFIDDENDKEEFAKKWTERQSGVRCYTMHTAKGTEADIVYILDAEDSIIPNQKRLSKTIRSGCVIDAAETVRNERSLVYVAITRAKKSVYIGYRNELSNIVVGTNDYDRLDRAYATWSNDYDDIKYFKEFSFRDNLADTM